MGDGTPEDIPDPIAEKANSTPGSLWLTPCCTHLKMNSTSSLVAGSSLHGKIVSRGAVEEKEEEVPPLLVVVEEFVAARRCRRVRRVGVVCLDHLILSRHGSIEAILGVLAKDILTHEPNPTGLRWCQPRRSYLLRTNFFIKSSTGCA